MKLRAQWDKLAAIMRRDLLTVMRHRNGFGFQAVALVTEIAGAFYLARAIGPSFRPDGIAYYPFLLIGTAVYAFLLSGIGSFVSAIQEAQMTGTMEVVLSTATPPSTILMLSACSAFAGGAITLVASIGAGALLARGAFHPNFLAAGIVLLLSLMVAAAVGMIAASIQLWLQKGLAVLWLMGTISGLLTGTAFPVDALPAPLRALTAWIPFTYSIRGLRMALLQGGSVAQVAQPILALAVSAAVLLPISMMIFSRVGRAVRLEGSLSFY